jgi:hypothetical protein
LYGQRILFEIGHGENPVFLIPSKDGAMLTSESLKAAYDELLKLESGAGRISAADFARNWKM